MSNASSTPQLHDASQPPPAPTRTAPRPVSQADADPTPPGALGLGTSNSQGKNAYNSDRPLDVNPTPDGGVAIGGQSDLPEAQASVGDRIIGKTQKVIGKYTNNPELHERGELRETGGKAAAEGLARAAHD